MYEFPSQGLSRTWCVPCSTRRPSRTRWRSSSVSTRRTSSVTSGGWIKWARKIRKVLEDSLCFFLLRLKEQQPTRDIPLAISARERGKHWMWIQSPTRISNMKRSISSSANTQPTSCLSVSFTMWICKNSKKLQLVRKYLDSNYLRRIYVISFVN